MEKLEILEIVNDFFLHKQKQTHLLFIRKDVRALIDLSNQIDSNLIKNICKKVDKKDLKRTFFTIAEEIFTTLPANLENNDGGQIDHINWGRVVALLCFSVEMHEYCKKKCICGNFADWCADVLTKRAEWLKNHSQDLNNLTGHYSYKNISFFSKITALTMLGVGIILFYTTKVE